MSGASTRASEADAPRRARSVPAVYGVVSLVLVAGALTFALSSPPPTTPPLAEVAPAPQENIEVERVEQSSRFGEGGAGNQGDCVAGDAGCEGVGEHPAEQTSGGAPDEVVERRAAGGLRRCSHGPGGPRQTDDPQSPPCVVEIFQGDNGGATARGVTSTEIRVVVPMRLENEDSTSLVPFFEALESHFNERYEFWGRTMTLDLVDLEERGISKPEDARAIASEVLARDPFASTEYPVRWRAEYVRAMADHGVIVTLGESADPLAAPEGSLLTDPHVWSVYPQFDEGMRALGDLVCTSLVDRPAQHAGDATLVSTTRRFGILVQTESNHRFDPAALTTRLDGCGAPHEQHEVDDAEPATYEGAIQRMRASGVTTVVCSCHQLDDEFTTAAEAAGWRPEWLLARTTLAGDGPNMTYGTEHPDAQLGSQFGLHAGLRAPSRESGFTRERFDEQYWYRAVLEERPDYEYGSYDTADELYAHYAQLLILASGIQAAGPGLTPSTFAAGLRSLRFPNPWVGQAPFFQPSVGFGSGDQVFNSDYSLWWFDPSDVSSGGNRTVRNRNKGQFCYVGDGARFTPGAWPTDADDAFFNPDAGCR